MNILFKWAVISSQLMLSGAVMANGGSIHMKAMVAANTCTVSNASRDQTVDMGKVVKGTLVKKGDSTTPVPFTIELIDCPLSTSSVGFTTEGATHGQASAEDPSLFAISSSSEAQGIGIALYDAQSGGQQILPGGAATASYPVIDGSATINLSAAVVQTSDAVIGGEYSAVTGFSIVYN